MSSSSSNHVTNSKECEPSLWCFFCYKESQTYLCSLDQYGETNANVLGNTSFLAYVRQCEDCALVLRDFCEFYEEMKYLEMKMNWKLNTLKAIMTSAERVPTRVNRIQCVLKKMDQEINVFAKMKRARKKFVSVVSAKMKSSFPRVKLKRWNNVNAALSSTSPNEQVLFPPSDILKSRENDFLKNNDTSVPGADISEPFLYDVKEPMEVEDVQSQIHEVSNANGPFESFEDLSADFSISEHDAADLPPNSPSVISPQLIETAGQSQNVIENNELHALLQEEVDESVNNECPPPSNDGREFGYEEDKNAMMSEIRSPNLESTIENELPDMKLSTTGPESVKDVKYMGTAEVEFGAVKSENIKTESSSYSLRPRNRRGKIRKIRRCALIRRQLKSLRTSLSSSPGQLPSLKECALKKLIRIKYICRTEPCKCRVFRNRNDQVKHSKLHGKFKCNFCSTSRKYAPQISEHEINAHKRLKARGLKSGSIACPRCDFRGNNQNHLLRHHLKSHLNLILDVHHTCPICDLQLDKKTSAQDGFMRHYLTFHDLSKMDVKLAKRCNEPMCRAYFRTSYQLLMHKMRVHDLHKKKRYGCEDCKKRFKTRNCLVDHRSKWHLTKVNFSVPCTFENCDKLFECEEDMLRHFKAYHELGNVTCPDCGKIMPKCKLPLHQVNGHRRGDEWLQNVKLTPEIRKMYGIFPTRCDLSESCQERFYNDKDFAVHSQLHGEFKCDQAQCDQVFQNAKNLALHELVHDQTVSPSPSSLAYPCPRCMFSAKDEVDFLSHFLEAHLKLSLDYHSCPICNFKFSYKTPCALSLVQGHFKIQHDLNKLGMGETVYKCEKEGCSAYFVTKLQIIAHRNNHKYEIKSNDHLKPYECTVCRKRFKTRPCVILHHKLHEDTTLPFRCPSDACAKRFGTKEALDSHLSESPVVMCEQCAKSFHEYSGLSAHSRVHKIGRAKKTFGCETCGKKFKNKESLHLHILTHSGKESWEFICSVCGRKMISKGKLKEHMKTHAKDRTYFICEICGAKYNQRHNLRIHVNSKHGDITWDAPHKYDKTNLTSRKGIKLKPTSGNAKKTPARRNSRKKKQKQFSSSSSESDE